tara:strand:- start:6134 stop:6670 length:537 start_codon:yes stop_codon:yes gene_type:complete
MKVIKKFIPDKNFNEIKKLMCGESSSFPWYFNPTNLKEHSQSNLKEHPQFMFVHVFKENNKVLSPYNEHLDICYEKIHKIFPYTHVARCKANLYTNQNKHVKHGKHQDMHDVKKYYMSAIYHINKCNGYTNVFNKKTNKFKKILQEENQLIIFSGDTTHYGVTQTDTQTRCVINFVVQ